MTTPTDAVDAKTQSFAEGAVTLDYQAIEGGRIRLTARLDDDVLESSEDSLDIFGSAQKRGTFINAVASAIDGRDTDVDPDDLKDELRAWFAAMNEAISENRVTVAPESAREILDATEYPVRIHGGETTIWKVTLTMNGLTRELEFTAQDMVNGGATVLKTKLANNFYFKADIEKEEWELINDFWMADENTVVVQHQEETQKDVQADMILRSLAKNLKPVDDREKLKNDPAAVWYDPENVTAYDADGYDGSAIAWVTDDFLVDQINTAGLDPSDKPEHVRFMVERGDLHGASMRKKWNGKAKAEPTYPFVPESLNLTEDDVTGGEGSAHSEVSV